MNSTSTTRPCANICWTRRSLTNGRTRRPARSIHTAPSCGNDGRKASTTPASCWTALVDSAPAGMEQRILAAVSAVPGVRNCHNIRVRYSGPVLFLDLHVLVDGRQTLFEAHALTRSEDGRQTLFEAHALT